MIGIRKCSNVAMGRETLRRQPISRGSSDHVAWPGARRRRAARAYSLLIATSRSRAFEARPEPMLSRARPTPSSRLDAMPLT